MTSKILVTGASGQLGTELLRIRWPDGWEATGFGRDDLDLSDPAGIASAVRGGDWAAVINCGAYTAVDAAESDVVRAWAVNALGPAALAAECAARDVPLVQLSTDYVFPGSKDGAYAPSDPVGPQSVYGASKLGGELAVATSGARHVILRTAWVLSAHGKNFLKTMLQLAEGGRDHVRVVFDQRGSPTSARDLAAAVATITVRLASEPASSGGVFHFSNSGPTNWAALAEEIFRVAARHGAPTASVERIPTSQYPTPAKRPANSLLDTSSLQDEFGIVPRQWQAAVEDIIDEIFGETQ